MHVGSIGRSYRLYIELPHADRLVDPVLSPSLTTIYGATNARRVFYSVMPQR